jgi:hypothetical protein
LWHTSEEGETRHFVSNRSYKGNSNIFFCLGTDYERKCEIFSLEYIFSVSYRHFEIINKSCHYSVPCRNWRRVALVVSCFILDSGTMSDLAMIVTQHLRFLTCLPLVKFALFPAVQVHIVIWPMPPSGLLVSYQSLGEICRCHLQDTR